MFKQIGMHLRKFRIGPFGITAFVILVLNACMRLSLIAHNWPLTNSDEDTLGLMALHIAYHGQFPIFFYGQSFLGPLEAYVGAAIFLLSGPTVFSLRLGMILLFTLFLVSMYLLTSLLYTKKLALFTLVVLSLGSPEVLLRELAAQGGHPETPLFGAVIVLFTTWLALTYKPNLSPRDQKRRIMLYGIWGCILGVAFWNDPLATPFILTAGLGLILFCRAELRKATLLGIVLGILVGVSPLLIYNFTSPIEQSSLSLFGFFTYQGPAQPHPSIIGKFAAALLVLLPLATEANPLCPLTRQQVWPITGQSGPYVIQCTLVHGTWGLGIIVLWAIAAFIAVREFRSSILAHSPEERRAAVIQFARLMLLASAGLSFIVFTFSAQGVLDPWFNNRYLVAFAVATPAVLWPLWATLAAKKPARCMSFRLINAKKVLSYGLLLLLVATLVKGTIDTFQQIPQVEAETRQDYTLVHDLLDLGTTHMYTDYWTCDLVIFLSRERIVCATLDEQLKPALDRYIPYKEIVNSDPHSSYVFPIGSPQATAFASKIAKSGRHYQHTIIDGYDIYQPIIQGSS